MNGLKSSAQRANRRRLLVFLGVFVVLAGASLFWNYSRPPEYRAGARVQINPGAVQVQSVAPVGGSQGVDAPRPLRTELQVLSSRPVVEATLEAIKASAAGGRVHERLASLGPDPVARLQASLALDAAGGTDVVEVKSTGHDAELAAALVNGVIATYRRQLEEAWQRTSRESLAQAVDEVAKLQDRVATKRRDVELYRLRHKIVSLEREENEVLARVRGLTNALNNANEKLASAEGKVRSMNESVAAGKPVVRTRSNATVENLEARAAQVRDELTELRRRYTDDYLALDNRARTLRARLAEIEAQVGAQREVQQQTAAAEQQVALSDARDEAAAARLTVERIQGQLASNRVELQQFTARFNEYKNLTAELAPLEALHRDALQRKARLEAGESARRPSVNVLEPAVTPTEAWRPLYARDAAIGLAASFTIALLMMWVVELFNRTEAQPTLVVTQPVGYPILGPASLGGPQLGMRDVRAIEMAPGGSSTSGEAADGEPALLGAPVEPPRELTDDEITRLVATSTDPVRVAALLLLGGLGPEEVLAAGWSDVDLDAGSIRVGGTSARALALFEPLRTLLARLPRGEWPGLMPPVGDHPMTIDELSSDLLFAAHDAGIERPSEVTPTAVRHTYLAFLARQGIRLGDLTKLAGRVPADLAAIYSGYAPAGVRLTLNEVERLMSGVAAAHKLV